MSRSVTTEEAVEGLRGVIRALDAMLEEAPGLRAHAARLVADFDGDRSRPYVDFIEDLNAFYDDFVAFGDTIAEKLSFDAPEHPFGRPPAARA
jgi:hypothetical protein